ncbi:MAG: Holliday junction resolvase RuvX [Patescibacteria group bacterium]|nr:Holliday junction resolvase RuvX [Patescibacteria group bacterium]
MTKYLGIDYGSKRCGLAVSDDTGSVAFPRDTLKTDSALVPSIIDMVRAEHVGIIVIGESKDKDGKDNPVMGGARELARELEQALAVVVRFEPEYYSSVEARKSGMQSFVDAQAAAIILNRYLERQKTSSNGTSSGAIQ